LKKLQKIYLANFLTSGAKKDRPYCFDLVEAGRVVTLESYWKTKAVTDIVENHPHIKMFLDSGAHSLINLYSTSSGESKEVHGREVFEFSKDDFDALDRNKQIFYSQRRSTSPSEADGKISKVGAMRAGASGFVNFDFADSKEVKEFLEKYIAFVHKYEDRFDVYANLDIIFNPEKTLENQRYMESCGLKPLPVFHFAEDFKWLIKMIDEYDYIAISGLGADIKKNDYFQSFGDKVFRYIFESKQDIKVHGFAATSMDLLIRYPFYSIDSTTWVKMAAYGHVMVPKYNRVTGEFDYSTVPRIVSVSDVAKYGESNKRYYKDKFSKEDVELIEGYFDKAGVDKELLGSSMFERTKVCIFFYLELSRVGIEVDETKLMKSSRSFF